MKGEPETIWMERMLEIHLQHTREKVELLNALKARFGAEVAEVVAETARNRARLQWRAAAEKSPERGLETLMALLWEPLRSKGFVFHLEVRKDSVHATCTRCPIADMARAIGDREWLFHLTCGVDAAIVEGFNPAIGFRRTRTLMEGDSCCNHVYFMKDADEGIS